MMKSYLIGHWTTTGLHSHSTLKATSPIRQCQQIANIICGKCVWSILDNQLIDKSNSYECSSTLVMDYETSLRLTTNERLNFEKCSQLICKKDYKRFDKMLLDDRLYASICFYGGCDILEKVLNLGLPSILYVTRTNVVQENSTNEYDNHVMTSQLQHNLYKYVATAIHNNDYFLDIYTWNDEFAQALACQRSAKQ